MGQNSGKRFNLWKRADQVPWKLVLGLTPFAALFIFLMVELVRHLWGIRAEVLEVSQTLSLAEVIIGGAALTLGLPGLFLLLRQLREYSARSQLKIECFPKPFGDSQGNGGVRYRVEVVITNKGNATAHHFHLILSYYTPVDNQGKPTAVNSNKAKELNEGSYQAFPNSSEASGLFRLLPRRDRDGLGMHQMSVFKPSNLNLYPHEEFLAVTVDVFADNLVIDWRLATENKVEKGTFKCPRP